MLLGVRLRYLQAQRQLSHRWFRRSNAHLSADRPGVDRRSVIFLLLPLIHHLQEILKEVVRVVRAG